MKLMEHQIEAVNQARPILKKYNFVYIFGEPRIGKSLVAIELAKPYIDSIAVSLVNGNTRKALVLTKKRAIEGWKKYSQPNIDITNYEQISKLKPDNYSIIIIDEAHNFGTLPKPSKRIKLTREFCKDKPLIYLSGTPIIETPLAIYPQLSLSSYTPFFQFKNFYQFFKMFGEPAPIYLRGMTCESYTKYKPVLLEAIAPFIVRMKHTETLNSDEIIYITKTPEYADTERLIKSGKLGAGFPPFETASAQWMCAHRHEGGFYVGKKFKFAPKFDWLLDFCERHKDAKICVMAYFQDEQNELPKRLPENVTILSATSYCEGVDLSDYEFYILYSFGYSGSKFIQLRDRVVNIDKKEHKKVIIPLINGGFCERVYKCVSRKKNFNIRMMNEA